MNAVSELIAQAVLAETAQLYGITLLGYQPHPAQAPANPSSSPSSGSGDSQGWQVDDRMREIKVEMAAAITYRYNNKERRHETDVSDHLDDSAIRDRFLTLIRRYADTTDEALGHQMRAVIDAAILAQAIDDIELAEIEAEEAGDVGVPPGENRPLTPGEPGYAFRRRT